MELRTARKTPCLLPILACPRGPPPGMKDAHLLAAGSIQLALPHQQAYVSVSHPSLTTYHLPLLKSFHILALVPKQAISIHLSSLATIRLGARTEGGGKQRRDTTFPCATQPTGFWKVQLESPRGLEWPQLLQISFPQEP